MKVKKMILLATLTAAIGLSSSIASAEQTPVPVDLYYVSMHFTFDGKEYAPASSQKGFIYEGSSYVPLRFVSYALNKAVDWDQTTYTVTVRDPKQNEQVSIDEYKLNAQVRNNGDLKGPDVIEPTQVEAYFEHVNYVFDGKESAPPEDKPGIIMDGSLYVPIRFYSESVGREISWDQATYTVSANTKGNDSNAGKSQDTKTSEASGGKAGTGTNVPATGGTGNPVPGGGGTPLGPVTYDSIKAEADSQISALQSEASQYFYTLLYNYGQEPSQDATTKARYKAQGEAALAGYDSRFDAIMSNLSAKLTAGGYDTSIVQTYYSQYEDAKAIAKAAFGG
jgi:hypothetical protein